METMKKEKKDNLKILEEVVYPMRRALATMISRDITPSKDFLSGLWALQDEYFKLEQNEKEYVRKGK